MEKQTHSDHRVPHTQHVVGSGILPSCYFWGTLRTNNRQLRPRYRTTATKPYKSLIYFSICVVAFNQGVETADTAPWAVDAFRSPGDGPPPLPSRGAAILIIRVGEPLGRARAGWRSNVDFDIGEGYAVFKEKCIARYEALIAGPEALKKPLALPEDVSSKPRTNLKQTFLYVQRAAQPEQFHRATARRIEQARLQRVAYETANSIQFGEITAQHLDVVNARRPEASPFEVPADNTT